jgi:hypothetical protein
MTSLNNGIAIGLLRLLRGNDGSVTSVPFDRLRCCGTPLPADESFYTLQIMGHCTQQLFHRMEVDEGR